MLDTCRKWAWTTREFIWKKIYVIRAGWTWRRAAPLHGRCFASSCQETSWGSFRVIPTVQGGDFPLRPLHPHKLICIYPFSIWAGFRRIGSSFTATCRRAGGDRLLPGILFFSFVGEEYQPVAFCNPAFFPCSAPESRPPVLRGSCLRCWSSFANSVVTLLLHLEGSRQTDRSSQDTSPRRPSIEEISWNRPAAISLFRIAAQSSRGCPGPRWYRGGHRDHPGGVQSVGEVWDPAHREWGEPCDCIRRVSCRAPAAVARRAGSSRGPRGLSFNGVSVVGYRCRRGGKESFPGGGVLRGYLLKKAGSGRIIFRNDLIPNFALAPGNSADPRRPALPFLPPDQVSFTWILLRIRERFRYAF